MLLSIFNMKIALIYAITQSCNYEVSINKLFILSMAIRKVVARSPKRLDFRK